MIPARAATAALLAVAVVGGAGPARAACDQATAGAEAAAIRAHLELEARRARRWDVGWAVANLALAGGQLGLIAAGWVPLRDFDDTQRASLQVGAAKAAIGALGHVVLPLRLTRPGPPGGDACADLAAAERALAASADAERTSFLVNHAGGLLVNLGGWVVLGLVHDEWGEGFASFALGYPVALLNVYTQPRASWHAHRDGRRLAGASPGSPGWSLAPVSAPGYRGLVLTLGF